MGLTKQHLRYVRGPILGLIGNNSSIAHIPLNGVTNRYVAASACENILVWDFRKNEKVLTLIGEKSAVTCIACSPNFDFLAAGYADGFVRVFNLSNSECVIGFNGHKSAVTAIVYSDDGARLATGSKDTEIVVWDAINECGIVRFKGHKSPVTRCKFMKTRNVIITSSQDHFIKFWDLDIRSCVYTLTDSRSAVWDFVLLKNETLLIHGNNEQELNVYDITFKDSETEKKETLDNESDDDDEILSCKLRGTIPRQANGRLVSLVTDKEERFIACHGPGPLLEIFTLNSEQEIANSLRRRLKKERKKMLQKAEQDEDQSLTSQEVATLKDYIRKLTCVKGSGKIKAFDLITENKNIKIYLLLHNNCIETFTIDSQVKKSEPVDNKKIYLPGHRNNVQALSFSSDNLAMISGSGESIKIWNSSSQNCIRTMDCSQVTCLSFTPGDRHCIVGTRVGKLQLFDIASATLLQSEDAHTDKIWSMCMSPDQKGFVTGSNDNEVKFWEFELDFNDSSSSGKLSFQQTRVLRMPDAVFCVKLSPDNRLLAVATNDCTIKLFFVDTLKFFQQMYGHSQPVSCMDISYDGTLLVSGSGDKNVKIYGMDFANCHKSLFAHEGSVTSIQFIPKTHLFFSSGKDKVINQWNADTFEKIIKLQGHQGDVLSLAVSPNGEFLVSSSADQSIRLWERTDELVVLNDERENEREEQSEKEMNVGENNTVIVGEKCDDAHLAGRQTTETLKAADKFMEALDIYEEEEEKLLDYERRVSKEKNLPAPRMHPLMIALGTQTPLHFMMETLKKTKSSELEEAVLILNFDYMSRLIKVLEAMLEKNWEVELASRCVFFLLKVHHGVITSNLLLLPTIEKLVEQFGKEKKLKKLKDQCGFNLSGLMRLKQCIEEEQDVILFQDASIQVAEKRKRKNKRDMNVKRVLLTL